MKRIFINRVLAFLLIGATLTYAGCKDYDDDIGNVQTELSETGCRRCKSNWAPCRRP